MRVICMLAVVGAMSLLSLPAADAEVDGYQAGKEAFDRAEFEEAAKLWGAVQSKADPRVDFGLGRLLLVEGGKSEIERGLSLIKKSATSGYLPAQEFMGRSHLEPLYLPQDVPACLEWLLKVSRQSKAEKRGHPHEAADALLLLHGFYGFGVAIGPVKPDRNRWAAMLRESADMGDGAAQYYLGEALERGSAEMPRDLVEAHKYFVLSWKQDGGIFTPGNLNQPKKWHAARDRALRIRRKMSRDELDRSRGLVRTWLAAKDAGTLGWAFDPEKTLSKGERTLNVIEEMHRDIGAGMSSMDLETQMPCLPMVQSAVRKCHQGYVHHRTKRAPVSETRHIEQWTYDSGGSIRVYPVRYDDKPEGGLRWTILDPQA